jgi:hypothetical protein
VRRVAGRAWEGGGTGLYRARSARTLRGRLGAVAALWMLGLGGAAVALGAFMAAPDPPPTPSSGALPAGPGGTGPTLPASTPTRIDIDAIDVHAPVEAAGVDERGEAVVPPLTAPHQANWYKLGASPGEAGNAVILGHVDSRKVGAAVFYDLGRLKAGTLVDVTRADGIVAVFKVDGVALYQKASFPVDTVYGPNARAGLRLVTCGGTFDAKTHNYAGNTVVAATLVSWHRAGDADLASPLRTFIPELPPPPKASPTKKAAPKPATAAKPTKKATATKPAKPTKPKATKKPKKTAKPKATKKAKPAVKPKATKKPKPKATRER